MRTPAPNRRRAWPLRLSFTAPVAAFVFVAIAYSPASAAGRTATDVFTGKAVIPSGQSSPVRVDPSDISVRPDGAIGLGYRYEASGAAEGQLPGHFVYDEHGYLFFRNPADPSSLVGTRFDSGVFDLTGEKDQRHVVVADSDPGAYTSGIATVTDKPRFHIAKDLRNVIGNAGQLTYGYFTFTNNEGTFTGYATPDFTRFIIKITFDLPA